MIYLDPRAGSGYLLPLLHKRGLPAKLKRMDFGDAAFKGYGPDGQVQVGVEIKSVPDLLDSIISRRLTAHQIPGMNRTYDVRYLMVHGMWRDSPDGIVHLNCEGRWQITRCPIAYTSALGMLESISNGGVSVVQVANPVDGLQALYKWRSTRWGQHQTLKVFRGLKERSKGIVQSPPNVATAVHATTGIGWIRSHAISRRFRTTEDLVFATVDEIADVDGISARMAQRIYNTLRTR